MSEAASAVHLDPAAINALLAEFVDRPGKLTARFEAGCLVVTAGGLVLRITGLEVTSDGLDVRLNLASEGAGA